MNQTSRADGEDIYYTIGFVIILLCVWLLRNLVFRGVHRKSYQKNYIRIFINANCTNCGGAIECDPLLLHGRVMRMFTCPHCHKETLVDNPNPPIKLPEFVGETVKQMEKTSMREKRDKIASAKRKHRRKIVILSLLALFGFFLSIIFAPWEITTTPYDWNKETRYKIELAPIFNPPTSYNATHVHLMWSSVVMTWVAIGGAYASLLFLFCRQQENESSPKSKLEHFQN